MQSHPQESFGICQVHQTQDTSQHFGVDHKNDVSVYLRLLQDNLSIITATGDADNINNDFLPHIFMQLHLTTIPLFQQRVLTWQPKYMENSLQLMAMTLITMADEECQILKHSKQWVETIDPTIVAMKELLQGTENDSKALYEQLMAHLTKLVNTAKEDNKHRYQLHDNRDGTFRHYGNDTSPWVYEAPKDLHQKHTF